MRCLVALAAALIVFCPRLPAAPYVIDARHGSDDASGTPDDPWQTISRGVREAGPRDTVLVRGGVYRERVVFSRGGEPGRPITLRAAPGQRVVLTGADPVLGWTRCTPEDVPGKRCHRELFRVDLDWVPQQLFEGTHEMVSARTPKTGWWAVTQGLSLTEFADTEHLR